MFLLKHITIFIVCCWICILSISCWLLFTIFRPTPTDYCIVVCGNALIEKTGDAARDSVFVEGKAVYQNNCSACHHPIKDATGPALAYAIRLRSREWLCKFLTQPKFIAKDSLSINNRRKYGGMRCIKCPELSCEEVNAAITYVGYYR